MPETLLPTEPESGAESSPAVAPLGWAGSVVGWLFGKVAKRREPTKPTVPVARFQCLCISREAGSGSKAIARIVGARLGWKVYDDELLEAIAGRMEISVDEVKVFDELAPSMVQEWILPLREEYYAPQEAYLDHLAKLVEALGKTGHCVIVGRGAGFILPRESTLSVRVVAPLKSRSARMAERMGISVRTARRAARDLDRRRDGFARTMYRVDPADPHNYDLILDSQSLGVAIATEVILKAIEAGRPPARSVASAVMLPLKDDSFVGADEILGLDGDDR